MRNDNREGSPMRPADNPLALRAPPRPASDDGSALTITIHHNALPALVVEVTGELDLLTAPRLSDTLHAVARLDYKVLVLDLSTLKFMGSAGLATLVEAHQHAARHTSLRIVACGPTTLRPIQITGLDTLLDIYPSRADALA